MCLLDHAQPGSPIHDILEQAEWNIIDVDLDTAEVLLRIARVHCLAAVKDLENAVRTLRDTKF